MSKADQIVLERRLKPIYDAIDSDAPKKAIQEADKILKKHPNTVCAKVLKALALIRCERLSDAFAIIDALDVDGEQYDDTTLQAFVHCYKDAAMPFRICALYERVAKYAPNEQNLTQLFMSYVRTKQFKNQQTAAMRLFKEFSNPPYFFWAVMSIVMQARTNKELGQKMFYPLAERMLTTHFAKNEHKSASEVEAHALVLEGMGRLSETEKLLGTEPTKSLVAMPPQFTNTRRLRLLVKAGSFRLAMDRATESLKENADDWSLWTVLLDASFSIMQDPETSDEKTKAVLDKLVDTVTTHCSRAGKLRGPYLARFQLILRLVNGEKPLLRAILGTRLGEPLDLLMAHVRRFYTKPCCYSDIAEYLCLLNEEQSKQFYKDLEKFVLEVTSDGVTTELNQENVCRGVIVFERLRRRLGVVDRMNKEERRSIAENIIVGMVKPSRTDLSGGDLAQLAATILWAEWKKNNDWRSFYECILLLEWSASRFKSDPFSKLVLMRAYAHIGCLNRMIPLSKALDIKSVQRDTLGHVMFPIYELCGRFNLGLMHYTELADMYSQAEREISDCLIGGYKNGSFGQLDGLLDLLARMEKSILAVGGDVMNRYLSGLFVISDVSEAVNTLHGDDEAVDWESLVDNRDVTVVPSHEYGNIAQEIEETKEKTRKEFVDITQLRHLLSRAVAAIGRRCSAAQMRGTAAQFNVHLEYCKTHYLETEQPSRLLQSPSPVRLSQWVHGGHFTAINRLLQSSLDVAGAIDLDKDPSPDVLPTAEELRADLEAMFPFTSVSSGSAPSTPFHVHEELFASSRALQTLATCKMMVTLIGRRSALLSDGSPSKKKKSPVAIHCDSLHLCISAVSSLLHSLLDDRILYLARPGINLFPCSIGGGDWQPPLSDILSPQQSPVHDRILKSYISSLDDMMETINGLWPARKVNKKAK